MAIDTELLSLMGIGLQQMGRILEELHDNRLEYKEVLDNAKEIDTKSRASGEIPCDLCISFGRAYRAYGDILREINKAVSAIAECKRVYVDVIKSEQQKNT